MSSSSSSDSTKWKFLAIALGAAAAGFVLYKKLNNNIDNKQKETVITVTKAKISQLFVFPVKSCSGTSVSSLELLETGAKFDREWAVVDVSTGKVVTQREYPIMRCITAFVDDSTGSLVLSYANRRLNNNSNVNNTAASSATSIAPDSSIRGVASSSTDFSNIPTPNGSPSPTVASGSGDDMTPSSPATPPPTPVSSASRTFSLNIHKSNDAIEKFRQSGGDSAKSHILPVILWGIPGQLFDEGDDAAEFFSSIIGAKVRLGRIFAHRRPSQSMSHKPIAQEQDVVSMQDFSSLHVITEEGVQAIAVEADAVPNASKVDRVDALRFRPNVVVSGVPFPEEDFWKTFSISSPPNAMSNQHKEVKIRVAKHCGRCSIPTILTDSSRDKAYFPTGQMKKSRNAYYVHQVPMEFEGKQKWPMFGLNVFHQLPQGETCVKICVGDVVEITSVANKDEVLVFGE